MQNNSTESPTTDSSLYLVSCVSRKQESLIAAKDLYTSDWFRKAKAYVEKKGSAWRILSAEHGLIHPDAVIAPYERTLNKMGIAERKSWAKDVLKQLRPILGDVDRIIILAGARYREFLLEEISDRVPTVEIPLEGLGIGQQLAWFKRKLNEPDKEEMNRKNDLIRFYAALEKLEKILGGKRMMGECDSRQGWPTRGIYFFFEKSEQRTDSGVGLRVVRVGTHALKAGSKATLWKRLSQHKGVRSTGGGNHRGSIFRLLIGQARCEKEGRGVPTWGVGSSGGDAAQRFAIDRESIKAAEQPIEQEVSIILGAMPLLWLEIDDVPGPDSLRGYIERNAIALLSNHGKKPLDPQSKDWLGLSSNREKVRQSALWNSNHVDEDYDPAFLDVLERQISETLPNQNRGMS
jgi:hypothetical protein